MSINSHLYCIWRIIRKEHLVFKNIEYICLYTVYIVTYWNLKILVFRIKIIKYCNLSSFLRRQVFYYLFLCVCHYLIPYKTKYIYSNFRVNNHVLKITPSGLRNVWKSCINDMKSHGKISRQCIYNE